MINLTPALILLLTASLSVVCDCKGGTCSAPSADEEEEADNRYCSPSHDEDNADSAEDQEQVPRLTKKFLLYEVNDREGFNLRRDVYMRMAMLVHSLGPEWTLVLPPWSLLYHWHPQDSLKGPLPWKSFFHLESFNKVIKVTDFDEYKASHSSSVDIEFCLDYFADTFDEGSGWRGYFNLTPCSKHETLVGKFAQCHRLFSYEIKIDQLMCVEIEGSTETLKQVLLDNLSSKRSFLVKNAEVVVHSDYGNWLYWAIRRSMRFNKRLVNIGDQFRKLYLESDDDQDATVMPDDWTSFKAKRSATRGGPYLAVHFRRGDFAIARPKDVPSVRCAYQQIVLAATRNKLQTVFLSSDASAKEYSALVALLTGANLTTRFFSNETLLDGEVAIVDQWIAAHAKFFIGTYDSTFSFRIQEEREILGFLPETTFNAFCSTCGTNVKICKQQSEWKIVY